MIYLKLVMEATQVSLGAIYKNECRLVEQHCHELNIVGAFYYYFRKLFGEWFSPYCIDMEYSRMGTRKVAKEINVNAGDGLCSFCDKAHKRRIRSDFIIHKPGEDDNLLVIEFKGEWSSGCKEWDAKKLSELTKPIESRPAGESYVCGYKFGISIIMKDDGVEVRLFEKGERKKLASTISKECLIDAYDSYMNKKEE